MTTNNAKSARSLTAPATQTDALKSTKRQRPKSPCAIDVLPEFCHLCWDNCQAYINDFYKDSPRFTPLYVQGQIDLADALAELPTNETLRSKATKARNKLLSKAQQVKAMALMLKNYIQYAYRDKTLVEVELKAAGLYDYKDLKNNWKNISGMIKTAKQYLADNTAKLLENDNMPTAFPAEFDTAGNDYNNAWSDFIAKEAATLDGTGSREAAIANVLSELSLMLDIGKRIFAFDPQVARKFNAEKIKAQVQGKKTAGVKGTIKMAGTGLPQSSVEVSALVEGVLRTVLSDGKGKYLLRLPNGIYDIMYALPGTEPLTIVGRPVKPGVVGRLNVELVPLPESPLSIVELPTTNQLLQKAMEAVATNGEVAAGG